MMETADSLVEWVASRIRWVAVSVIDCLVKRMFLGEDLLAFGWMGMEREAGEAGLMTGI